MHSLGRGLSKCDRLPEHVFDLFQDLKKFRNVCRIIGVNKERDKKRGHRYSKASIHRF